MQCTAAQLEGAAEGMLAPRTLRPRPVSECSPCLALNWFLNTKVNLALTGDGGVESGGDAGQCLFPLCPTSSTAFYAFVALFVGRPNKENRLTQSPGKSPRQGPLCSGRVTGG